MKNSIQKFTKYLVSIDREKKNELYYRTVTLHNTRLSVFFPFTY